MARITAENGDCSLTLAAASSFDEREIEMAMQSASTVPQLGELLRYWRQERGKSQLALSLDTGISQRHLSFVESGRSAPSRDLLSVVFDALNIPLRERNALLLMSGFAPKYSEQSIDAEQMAVVTQAIDRAKGPAGSGGTGTGCETPGAAEAVAGVSRCSRAKAITHSTESSATHGVSKRERALLVLFFNYNRRYAPVHHGTGTACGVYVSDRNGGEST